MARKRTDLMDLRQLIQLKQQGHSNREAAELLNIHRNTVNDYVRLFLSTDRSYLELLSLDNSKLEELFPHPILVDQKRYEILLDFLKQVENMAGISDFFIFVFAQTFIRSNKVLKSFWNIIP
ncbi:MAG: helix-turn-helix domain-containing protein [Bacteroidia bacterium]|nr:helix-turn-helix domain-containing protein [Bacteroidia bacterium]